MVDQLANVYKERRVAVVSHIYVDPDRRIGDRAEAVGLKKDDNG
jgi:hypothetical protein